MKVLLFLNCPIVLTAAASNYLAVSTSSIEVYRFDFDFLGYYI